MTKLRVLDLFSGIKSGKGRLAGSASYQAARDTLGKGSTLSQVSCSCLTAMRRCGGVLAYARYQALFAHRTIGKLAARQEIAGRSVSSFHQAHVSQRHERSNATSLQGLLRKILSGCRERSEQSTCQNSAIGSHLPATSNGIWCRIAGSAALIGHQASAAAIEPYVCSPHNTTSLWPCQAETRSRKIRSVSEVWS